MAIASTGGGGDGTGGGGSTGGGRRKYQRGKDKDGNALPICPHCKKLRLPKPNLGMQEIFPLDPLMESAHYP